MILMFLWKPRFQTPVDVGEFILRLFSHRFKELQQKHGNVEQFADIELKPDFKRTVEVHFQDKITIKVINISKTVGELKKRLAQEVAGVESRQVYLYYQDAIGWTKKLTVMPKLLYTLKIEDGDKFFIDLKYNQ